MPYHVDLGPMLPAPVVTYYLRTFPELDLVVYVATELGNDSMHSKGSDWTPHALDATAQGSFSIKELPIGKRIHIIYALVRNDTEILAYSEIQELVRLKMPKVTPTGVEHGTYLGNMYGGLDTDPLKNLPVEGTFLFKPEQGKAIKDKTHKLVALNIGQGNNDLQPVEATPVSYWGDGSPHIMKLTFLDSFKQTNEAHLWEIYTVPAEHRGDMSRDTSAGVTNFILNGVITLKSDGYGKSDLYDYEAKFEFNKPDKIKYHKDRVEGVYHRYLSPTNRSNPLPGIPVTLRAIAKNGEEAIELSVEIINSRAMVKDKEFIASQDDFFLDELSIEAPGHIFAHNYTPRGETRPIRRIGESSYNNGVGQQVLIKRATYDPQRPTSPYPSHVIESGTMVHWNKLYLVPNRHRRGALDRARKIADAQSQRIMVNDQHCDPNINSPFTIVSIDKNAGLPCIMKTHSYSQRLQFFKDTWGQARYNSFAGLQYTDHNSYLGAYGLKGGNATSGSHVTTNNFGDIFLANGNGMPANLFNEVIETLNHLYNSNLFRQGGDLLVYDHKPLTIQTMGYLFDSNPNYSKIILMKNGAWVNERGLSGVDFHLYDAKDTNIRNFYRTWDTLNKDNITYYEYKISDWHYKRRKPVYPSLLAWEPHNRQHLKDFYRLQKSAAASGNPFHMRVLDLYTESFQLEGYTPYRINNGVFLLTILLDAKKNPGRGFTGLDRGKAYFELVAAGLSLKPQIPDHTITFLTTVKDIVKVGQMVTPRSNTGWLGYVCCGWKALDNDVKIALANHHAVEPDDIGDKGLWLNLWQQNIAGYGILSLANQIRGNPATELVGLVEDFDHHLGLYARLAFVEGISMKDKDFPSFGLETYYVNGKEVIAEDRLRLNLARWGYGGQQEQFIGPLSVSYLDSAKNLDCAIGDLSKDPVKIFKNLDFSNSIWAQQIRKAKGLPNGCN